MPNRSTAILGFRRRPVRHDLAVEHYGAAAEGRQEPGAAGAICELSTNNGSTNLLLNRDKPPFDNADLRKALALAIDRKSFIDILTEGQGKIGGAMLPPPEGLWGMPPEMLQTVPGFGPDVQKNRADAREIMEKLGYGPEQAARGQGLDPQRRRPTATRR